MNRTVKATVGLVAIAAMSLTGLAACGGSSADDGKGKVYFLNFKPEAADQWVALAKKYTDKTGVQVKVQTAASGTYEQTLKSELANSDAPTIFQVNGPVGYQNWKGYTADLTDSDIYKEMNDQSLALKGDDGQIVGGIGSLYIGFIGLIVNEGNGQGIGALHHMGVGNDIAVGGSDNAGAFTGGGNFAVPGFLLGAVLIVAPALHGHSLLEGSLLIVLNADH